MFYLNTNEMSATSLIKDLKNVSRDEIALLFPQQKNDILHESVTILSNDKIYTFISKINIIDNEIYILKINYNAIENVSFKDEDILSKLIVSNLLFTKFNYNVNMSPNYFNLFDVLKKEFDIKIDQEQYQITIGTLNNDEFQYYQNLHNISLLILKKNNYFPILCKITMTVDNINLMNFRKKIQKLSDVINVSQFYTDKNIKKLYTVLKETDLLHIVKYNDKYDLGLLNTDISTTRSIINCIDLDKIEKSKTEINIEVTKKRLKFLEKLINEPNKLLSKIKVTPFKISNTRSVYHNQYIQIHSFFGKTYEISKEEQLFNFERLLYICNKYDDYEASIRQLILEVA